MLQTALLRLSALLERISHPRAAEVRELADLLQVSPELAMRQLDSNAWWAGAGSLAAETMIDNPGLPEGLWQSEVREFRALLIEIGELIKAEGATNPGLGSWLLAFSNWNASEV
ncbi:hypothetical protein F2Q65_18810 [Thiohalocapsa marina]|uniref:Uncharacterized protein n=1 Tax=Thiohalocapsa marina TaxID=424902 RepID=A0A5M8FAX9_9GAMM|nr:hypothetical protein [Thiohalocapsa marina]KAA6181829.1 hypothetical protein F2Q65_18810 [Thiohalocapsa marina]